MNLENISLINSDSFSNFNNNVLNPFLEKSKHFYSNSIIESDSNRINITLLKEFPRNNYSFEYEEAINLIFIYLKKLQMKFGFKEIKFHDKIDYGFNPSFNIKVSSNISSKDLNNYSEKLFKMVGKFAEDNDIEFILDDLSIILCR